MQHRIEDWSLCSVVFSQFHQDWVFYFGQIIRNDIRHTELSHLLTGINLHVLSVQRFCCSTLINFCGNSRVELRVIHLSRVLLDACIPIMTTWLSVTSAAPQNVRGTMVWVCGFVWACAHVFMRIMHWLEAEVQEWHAVVWRKQILSVPDPPSELPV